MWKLVCEDEWTSFKIGDKINCLKEVGLVELNNATSKCQSLNASQILPRSRQESDDLVSALLSLDLASENGKTLVSVGIYTTKRGGWYDSAGQLISYFDWLPNEPNIGGNLTHAALRIDKASGVAGWAGYSAAEELKFVHLVCTKSDSQG